MDAGSVRITVDIDASTLGTRLSDAVHKAVAPALARAQADIDSFTSKLGGSRGRAGGDPFRKINADLDKHIGKLAEYHGVLGQMNRMWDQFLAKAVLVGGALSTFTPIIGALGGALGVASGGVAQLVTGLGALAPAAAGAFGALKIGFSGLSEGAKAYMKGIKGDQDKFFGEIGQLMAPMLDAWVKVSGDIQRSFAQELAPSFKNLGDLITGIGPGLKSINSAFADVANNFTGMLTRAQPQIDAITTGSRQLVSIVGPGLTSAAQGFLNASAAAQRSMPAIAGAFRENFDKLGATLSGIATTPEFQGALQGFAKTVQSLGDAVIGLLPHLVKLGADIGPLFADFVNALGPEIGRLVDEFGELGKAVGPALPGLIKAFGDGIAPLIKPLGELGRILAEQLTTVLPTVGQGLADIIGPMVKALPTMGTLVEALAKAITASEPLITAVSQAIGGIATTLVGAIQQITPAINTLAQALAPLAQAMGKGVADAIIALTPAITVVADAISGIAIGLSHIPGLVEGVVGAFVLLKAAGPFAAMLLELNKFTGGLIGVAPQVSKVTGDIEKAGTGIYRVFSEMRGQLGLGLVAIGEVGAASDSLVGKLSGIAGTTAGGALIGSIFGPAGTAVGAAAGAAIGLITSALSENARASAAAAAEQAKYAENLKATKAATDAVLSAQINLNKALLESKGAVDASVIGAVQKQLEALPTYMAQHGFAADTVTQVSDALKTLGINQEQLANIISGSQPIFDALVTNLNKQGPAGQFAADQLTRLRDGILQSQQAAQAAGPALQTLADSLHTSVSQAAVDVKQAFDAIPHDVPIDVSMPNEKAVEDMLRGLGYEIQDINGKPVVVNVDDAKVKAADQALEALGVHITHLPDGTIEVHIDPAALNNAYTAMDNYFARYRDLIIHPQIQVPVPGPSPSMGPDIGGRVSGGVVRGFQSGGWFTGNVSPGDPRNWRIPYEDEMHAPGPYKNYPGWWIQLLIKLNEAGGIPWWMMPGLIPTPDPNGRPPIPADLLRMFPPSAAGGMLPGYSPGRDNMLVPLSGGEGIVIPEAMRALGPGWLYRLNSRFRKGISRRGYQEGGVPHLGTGDFPGPIGPDDGLGLLTQIRDLLAKIQDILATAAAKATAAATGPAAAAANQHLGTGASPGPSAIPGAYNWQALAQAESGGNWQANTGNNYFGGLQFDQSTWDAYKPAGAPARADQATMQQQIQAAQNAINARGGPQSLWPKNWQKLGAVPTTATAAANLPAAGGAAGLISFAQSVSGGKWQLGASDLVNGLSDCSGAISDLVELITKGQTTPGRLFYTGNAAQVLQSLGAVPGAVPGMLQIGWSAEHMRATLPNGIPFESGGGTGQGATYGYPAKGALGMPNIMSLPVGNVPMGAANFPTGVGAPGGVTPVYVTNWPGQTVTTPTGAPTGQKPEQQAAAFGINLAQQTAGAAITSAGGVVSDVTGRVLNAIPQALINAEGPRAPSATVDQLLQEGNPALALAAAAGLSVEDFTRAGGPGMGMITPPQQPGYDASGRLYSDTAALLDRTMSSLSAQLDAMRAQLVDLLNQVLAKVSRDVLEPIIKSAVQAAFSSLSDAVVAAIGGKLGDAAAPPIAKATGDAVATSMPAQSGGLFGGGGLFGLFDEGGDLPSGTAAVNLSGATERVLSPDETRLFNTGLLGGPSTSFSYLQGVSGNATAFGDILGLPPIGMLTDAFNMFGDVILSIIGVNIEIRDTLLKLSADFRSFRGDAFKAFEAQGRLLADTSDLIDRSLSTSQMVAMERARITQQIVAGVVKFVIDEIIIPIGVAIAQAGVSALASAASTAISTGIGASGMGVGSIPAEKVGEIAGSFVGSLIQGVGNAVITLTAKIIQALSDAIIDVGTKAIFDYIGENFGGFGPPQPRGQVLPNIMGKPLNIITNKRYMRMAASSAGFDLGGLAYGTGLMPKSAIEPERVLSPRETAAFERLVDALTGGKIGATRGDVTINAPFTMVTDGREGAEQAHDRLLALLS